MWLRDKYWLARIAVILRPYFRFPLPDVDFNQGPVTSPNEIVRTNVTDIPVTAVRYHGTIHDFVMLNVIAGDPARAAIEQASIMLKDALWD
jgi:hypothetical protein